MPIIIRGMYSLYANVSSLGKPIQLEELFMIRQNNVETIQANVDLLEPIGFVKLMNKNRDCPVEDE
jgi:hypothetical protein